MCLNPTHLSWARGRALHQRNYSVEAGIKPSDSSSTAAFHITKEASAEILRGVRKEHPFELMQNL